MRRYMYDTFEETIAATVGMDFQSKTAYLEDVGWPGAVFDGIFDGILGLESGMEVEVQQISALGTRFDSLT